MAFRHSKQILKGNALMVQPSQGKTEYGIRYNGSLYFNFSEITRDKLVPTNPIHFFRNFFFSQP